MVSGHGGVINFGSFIFRAKYQSINQTRQFLTRRNTAKPLQGSLEEILLIKLRK